jgi:hypothetical protein
MSGSDHDETTTGRGERRQTAAMPPRMVSISFRSPLR